MCVLQVVHHGLVASHSLEAPQLLTEIRHPHAVLHHSVGAVVVGIRPSHNADDREVLTIGVSHGVEDA